MKHAGLYSWALPWPLIPAAAPAPAHHSISATYDSARQVKLQGIVTRIDWVNPHAYIFINVRDTNGTVTNWALEIGNPFDLERDGWKRGTLRIGDTVAIEGNPAHGESRQAPATSVVLAGKKLFAPAARAPAAAPRQPAPRIDGRITLGPPPGGKGYWGTPSAKTLAESGGAKIAMNDDGLLMNLADAGEVAPFQPWAKALYEYRQRTLLKEDPATR